MGFTGSLKEFAGLPVVGFPPAPGAPLPEVGEVAEAAWRIDVFNDERPSEPFAIDDVFERFLDTVDTERVTALVVGSWAELSQVDGHPARLLTESAQRLPALRALSLGDVADEIMYVEHSDLTPMLQAYPGLEELWVRGTPDLSQKPSRYFEPLRHTGLRRLVLPSGGLHPDVIHAISECDFPELRHLELYLGQPAWCGWAKPGDLAWLMAGGTFPKLRHLGLRNALIQDEVAAAVAQAPVVAGLSVLDLSLGALGDVGGQALLRGQPLGHLAALDLHHNYFSEAMQDRLRTAWPGVDVDLSETQTEYNGRRFVAVAE